MDRKLSFIQNERKNDPLEPIGERIDHFREIHRVLDQEDRKLQASRCMDCGVPYCLAGMQQESGDIGCPLHNLIPEWNASIAGGDYADAYDRLIKTDNFPSITSRICPAPCETACNCNLITSAVTIRDNERAVADYGEEHESRYLSIPKQRTGKRIAIVGSGPAGLAAADTLNQRGHMVDVYERSDRVGGMLTYGVPNMRLDQNVVVALINKLVTEGIAFIPNTDIGKDISLQKLQQMYDRVILACGSRTAKDIDVPGRDGKNIHFAIEYLESITKSLLSSGFKDGKAISADEKHVIIIGGGDTATDCVAMAIRQNAASVLQVEQSAKPPMERSSTNPWPQWPDVYRVDYGQAEARYVYGEDPRIFSRAVTEFVLGDNHEVSQVRLADIVHSAEGDRIDTTHQQLQQADLVIIAIGYEGCERYTFADTDIQRNNEGCVVEENYKTQEDGIYVAGDMRRGSSLVVWAIKEGREVAAVVDKDLMGFHQD